MRVEALTNSQDVSALASRWDELACMDPRDGFFRTHTWYSAWMQHIRPDAKPYVLVVRDQLGGIAGIAPMCQATYQDLGFRLEGLRWAAREVVSGDFLDLVCAPAMRSEVTAATLDYLGQTRSNWSLLVLGELIAGGESHTAAAALANRWNLPIREQEQRICPYIALPGTFDAYLETLGSSTRYHIRRRTRDVEKRGAEVRVLKDPVEVADTLPELIRLHVARWRTENQPGTLSRPGIAACLRQVCLNLPADSSVRLHLLRHEGKAAAALLAFHFGESAVYYQAGWDPDSPLTSLSPAVVLMANSIRTAIVEGKKYYEFLRGDEDYKSRWTTTHRTTTTVLIGRSFMAKEYLRVANLKDNVKQVIGLGRVAPTVGAGS